LLIRPATPADILSLLALEQQAVTAAHWSAEQYQAALSNSPPRRVTLVAEDQGAAQGFLVARGLDQEWEIENVVVALAVRRRGFGKRLLREFLEWARLEGAEAMCLEVRQSNHGARALYEKCGFVEAGSRPHCYRQPEEDAVLYRLSLL
jgi:ribosomal-protein-alanine N-acetyltransferase